MRGTRALTVHSRLPNIVLSPAMRQLTVDTRVRPAPPNSPPEQELRPPPQPDWTGWGRRAGPPPWRLVTVKVKTGTVR